MPLAFCWDVLAVVLLTTHHRIWVLVPYMVMTARRDSSTNTESSSLSTTIYTSDSVESGEQVSVEGEDLNDRDEDGPDDDCNDGGQKDD